MMSTGAFTWCPSYHWSQVKTTPTSSVVRLPCFPRTCNLNPSLVKEVANHKQNSSQTLCSNPARYSEADKKKVHSSTTGKLKSSDYEVKSPVCPGYRKWRGVGCSNDWCITPCKLDFLSLNYFSYMFSLTCFNKSCSILRPAIVAYP